MKLKNYSNYEIYPEEGKIYSYKTNSFLKGFKTRKGYKDVDLINDDGNKKTLRWHRVIYMAANGLERLPEGFEIDHINTIRDDNRIENLRLVTPKGNSNNPLTLKHINESRLRGENHPLYGKPMPEETKEKLRQSNLGKTPWMKGKHHTQESKEKISASKLANPTKYWLGKERSEETKKKISESKTGCTPWNKGKKNIANSRSKKIVARDKETGEVVKVYDRLSYAVEDGYRSSAVCDVISGRKKSYKGFLWSYAE